MSSLLLLSVLVMCVCSLSPRSALDMAHLVRARMPGVDGLLCDREAASEYSA
jgi:hypothetical protein